MTPRLDLRLTSGALAPDGGSIYLEGTANGAQPVRVYLDWSLAAQAHDSTSLAVDDRILTKGSEEEAVWIVAIAAADTLGNATVTLFRDTLVEKVLSPAYRA
jgi:hypothetical protein